MNVTFPDCDSGSLDITTGWNINNIIPLSVSSIDEENICDLTWMLIQQVSIYKRWMDNC